MTSALGTVPDTAAGPAQVSKLKSRIEKFVLLLQLVVLLASPFFIVEFRLFESSPFIKDCPSQYGGIVLSVLMSGLFSIVLTCGCDIAFEKMHWFSRAMLLIAFFPVSALIVIEWFNKFTEAPIDRLGGITLVLSGLMVSASAVESWGGSGRQRWRDRLFFVDLPLLVVGLTVVLFRYFCYDWSTDQFHIFLANRATPPYRTPDLQMQQEHTLQMLKEGFWMGFSTGVVGVQVIISQLVSMLLRFDRIRSNEGPSGALVKT